MISQQRYRMITRVAAMVLLAGVLIALGSAVAHACPNCGLDVLEDQKGGASVAQGFTYSMVCMASAPFLVFSTVATYIYRLYRRR